MTKRLISLTLVLCMFASAFFSVPVAQAASRTMYAVSNIVSLYETASNSAKVLDTVAYGESITCFSTADGWAEVRNAAGKVGYCPTNALSAANPNNMNIAATVNTANAPLYKQPSAGIAPSLHLPKGATYTAVAMTPDNAWVRLKNGNYYGYMEAKYLSTTGVSPQPTAAPTLTNATVYTVATTLPVYTSMSTNSQKKGILYYGQSVTCIRVSGNWAWVRNSAGNSGYCQVSGISTSNPNNLSKKVYINTEGAPIYKAPSISASIWMRLKKNSFYTAVAVTPDGTWTRLKNGNYYAYILSKYVSDSSDVPQPAPTDEPSISAGTVYVNANTVTVYHAASSSAKAIGMMSYGESITLVKTSGSWAQVRNAAGTVGYCDAASLTSVNPNTLSRKVYIDIDGAPIYKIASTSTAVWMKLPKNASYTAVAVTPDGSWTRMQNGKYYAYIPSKYLSTSLTEEGQGAEQTMYVAANILSIYESASESAKIVGTMYLGQSLSMIGMSDGWAKVRNASGKVGYCAYIGLSAKNPNTLNRPYYAKNQTVKLYTAPSTSASVACSVAQNTSLMAVCLSEDGTWARILLNDGSYVYARTSDLSESSAGDNSPIKDITPVTVYAIPTTVPVYSAPNTSSRTLGTFYFGQAALCTGANSAWARIVNSSGAVGYCDINSITKTDPNIYSTKLYAQVDGAKVYQKPLLSSAVLATLPQNGTVVGVMYNSDRSWYRVKLGNTYGYVLAPYFATSEMKDSATSGAITKVIAMAKTFIGVPYLLGGQTPDAFDCSGLIYYCFKNTAGITLKRTAHAQGYDEAYPLVNSMVELKVGDLIFFNTVEDGPDDLCDHVGIYLGGNQFIHASSGGGKVMISSLGTDETNYYFRTYSWARRIIS